MSDRERNRLSRLIPAVHWLPRYDRSWLSGDLVAGLTVWALVVPESMAYAGVAGVPVQYGLYAVPLAVVGYAVFGSSRRLFVGPSSTVAALSAVVVGSSAVAGGDDFIVLSAALAVLVGALYVVAGLLRLGFVANFFAKPVLDGFIAGLGLFILVGQIPKLVGIDSPAGNTITKALRTFGDIGDWSAISVGAGVVALVLLFGMERINPRLPAALIVAALGVAATALLKLADLGLEIVGDVPTGFAAMSWGSVTWAEVVAMTPGALGILVVGYAQSVAIAKAYSAKYGDATDASQEMIGYGAANIGAGALGGITVTGSLTKSAAAESAGGRTPVVSVVAGVATLATILFLAGIFEDLPETVLAAIVIHAVWGMVDLRPLIRLRRMETVDFWLAVAALLGVVVIGILPGIIIGVVLSLMLFQHRVDRPHSAILGRRPDGETYGDIVENPEYVTDPDVLVFRWDAPLIFANADYFTDRVLDAIHSRHEATTTIVLDFEACFKVDTTGSAALRNVHGLIEDDGLTLRLAHVHAAVEDFLRREGALGLIGPDRLHDTIRGAVRAAGSDSPGEDTTGTLDGDST